MHYHGNCPECKTHYQISSQQLGMEVKCRKCRKAFRLTGLPSVTMPEIKITPNRSTRPAPKSNRLLAYLMLVVFVCLAGVGVIIALATNLSKNAAISVIDSLPNSWQNATGKDITDAAGVAQMAMMLASEEPARRLR